MRLECVICEHLARSAEELSLHMHLHDPSDRVVCRQCGCQSTTVREHRQHTCFSCPKCAKRLTTKSALASHSCYVDQIKPFVCVCGTAIQDYSELLAHARGPKDVIRCCSCYRVAKTISGLMRHIRNHLKKNFYQCSTCQSKFPTKRSLRRHLKENHANDIKQNKLPENKIKCEDCGKRVSERALDAHRVKHNVASCLCPDCGKLCGSPAALSKHLSLHEKGTVTCDMCEKVLKTKKILAEHIKTHMTTEGGARVAQAICPLCGIKLAQKGSLQRHILSVHEPHKIQKKSVPRTCTKCGITLPSSTKYYTHMRQHRAELEQIPCTICSRVFNKRHNMQRHVYLVHSEQRHRSIAISCQFCLKQFRSKHSLLKHFHDVHQIKEEPMVLVPRLE